jgi:hypothetical protein
MSRLNTDMKPGDSIRINNGADAITITLMKKDGQIARVQIQAGEQTKIDIPRRNRNADKQARKSAPEPRPANGQNFQE